MTSSKQGAASEYLASIVFREGWDSSRELIAVLSTA